MANKIRRWSSSGGKANRRKLHLSKRGLGAETALLVGGQLITMQELEPRLVLASLTYADLVATPPLTTADITRYLASVVSTNYTLRAENQVGNFVWQLYGTGTDLVPFAPVPVLQAPISSAADLDLTVEADVRRVPGTSHDYWRHAFKPRARFDKARFFPLANSPKGCFPAV